VEEKMSVASLSAYYPSIKEIYNTQANSILNNDIDTLISLHSDKFFAIPLDGSKRNANEWAKSVQREMNEHDYRQVTYEIQKITTDDDASISVYATRRCSGVNSAGSAFNTEVDLRDEFLFIDNNLLMRSSETVSRKLWLNGDRIQIERVPEIVAMVQGCSDQEMPR
jgi:hypothetical protein